MADTLVVETAGGTTEEELERKLEKKRAKIRSAWISFVGRIVAQIMGAVATISLGLMLVQKYHSPSAAPAPEPGQSAPQGIFPVRLVTPGASSLAVLPLHDVSADGETSFARGMTDALITDLAHLDAVRVVSRTSSAVYEKGDGRSRRSRESSAWTSSSRGQSQKPTAGCGSPSASSRPGATSNCWPQPTIARCGRS